MFHVILMLKMTDCDIILGRTKQMVNMHSHGLATGPTKTNTFLQVIKIKHRPLKARTHLHHYKI